ncbi:MAG: DoxX family protein [Patescibacteria group bacterium]|nr:DoxX family protein [Patescibacteria group bacterium]
MFPLLGIWSDWGLLLLRVIAGIVFVVHGWPKFRKMHETAVSFESMGFKPGKLWGPAVAILEFFGGIALLVGFATELIAALLCVQFIIIIIWKVTKGQKFVSGWEYDLVLLGVVASLIVLGSGMFSLDKLFFSSGL